MSKKLSILIVDDEKSIVLTLRQLLSQDYSDAIIYSAYDGNQAWEMVKMHSPMIVITDITMPGLSGHQLIKKIRETEEYKNVYILVMTASNDKSQRLQAIDLGADDYVSKPFIEEEIKSRFRTAQKVAVLQSSRHEESQILLQLAEELQKDISDMVLLSIKFCQTRMPDSAEMLKRVAESAVWIARMLGESDEESIRDIEIASLLSYSGKLFLPDTMIKLPVLQNGLPTNNLMYQVPVFARDIVSSVRRFKDIGSILYHIWENFDGSGIPDHVQMWKIPLASRVIRISLDFEEMRTFQKEKPMMVMKKLHRESKRLYDHRAVTLLDQFLATKGWDERDYNEHSRNLDELEDGMILSRDIITNSGIKILSAGAVLKTGIIEKIRTINTSDPILGSIFVIE